MLFEFIHHLQLPLTTFLSSTSERLKQMAESMIGRLIQKKKATRGRFFLSHITRWLLTGKIQAR